MDPQKGFNNKINLLKRKNHAMPPKKRVENQPTTTFDKELIKLNSNKIR